MASASSSNCTRALFFPAATADDGGSALADLSTEGVTLVVDTAGAIGGDDLPTTDEGNALEAIFFNCTGT